jgi:hypothetical protein
MSRDIGLSNQRAPGHISVSIPTRDVASMADKTLSVRDGYCGVMAQTPPGAESERPGGVGRAWLSLFSQWMGCPIWNGTAAFQRLGLFFHQH